jgi:hypothetical protein
LDPFTKTDTNTCQYGLVYPGVGWVVWRSPEYLPQDLVFNINYLGADQASFTLNFSKGASQVVGQYYQLIRLGRSGYRAIMSNITRTADYLSTSLEEQGFVIMSRRSGEGLPLVAFRYPDPTKNDDGEGREREYDEFSLARSLRSRGWVVPAYTMAPHTNKLKMLRVVVREDFSRSKCDMLIADIKLCCDMLDKMNKETLKKQEAFIQKYITNHAKSTSGTDSYHVKLFLLRWPCFFFHLHETGRDSFATGSDWQDPWGMLNCMRICEPTKSLHAEERNAILSINQPLFFSSQTCGFHLTILD